MPVFKTYFKIIQKNMGSMIVYFTVFIALAILMSVILTNEAAKVQTATVKTRVALINRDADSELVKGFREYLNDNETLVSVNDDMQSIQDSLFYRDAEYIIVIPEGFTENILNGGTMKIEKYYVPDSASQVFMDFMVNNYFNTARVYIENSGTISQKSLTDHIKQDLLQQAKVEIRNYNGSNDKSSNLNYYYSYVAYSMIAIVLLGVTTFMMIFNDRDIKRRNLCSPMKQSEMNLFILFGNLTFTLTVWALSIVTSIVLFQKRALTVNSLFMWLNLLVFAVSILSLSFFISNIIKSKRSQQAIANTLSLGLSFISGVFVPQEFLGKTVQTIASFTPTYWYVKANDTISKIVSFSAENMMPAFRYMMIELGFAVAIFAVALVVIKQKKVTNS